MGHVLPGSGGAEPAQLLVRPDRVIAVIARDRRDLHPRDRQMQCVLRIFEAAFSRRLEQNEIYFDDMTSE